MVKSGGLQPVLQAGISNGLSLDPFSIGQDGWTTSEVDVGRGEIVDALVVEAGGGVVDEGRDLGFEIAGQEVVFQQDAVFESLMPALDLALRHWMIGRTAQVLDLALVEPLGEDRPRYNWNRYRTKAEVDPRVRSDPTPRLAAQAPAWR